MSRSWDIEAMPDQSGQTVIVTGANSGLGFEATRAFAQKGATVVMACRDRTRAQEARAEIRSRVESPSLPIIELDLASLASIQSFTETFEAEHGEAHVLCNNAGLMAIPRRETADGFEMQFGVNHLGHFALTAQLLDVLCDTEGESRVVTQSSGLHENGEMSFDDLHGESAYDKWDAYAQSKLANLLFAYELDRRLPADASVTSVGCHPGYADTDLQRRGPEMMGSRLRLAGVKLANALVAQSSKQGALPMLYAATSPEIAGGEYVGPGGFMNMRGAPAVQSSSDRSTDEAAAARLWEVSEELTGVTFDIGDG
ncbi:NAD(P)-dependent dehydrogenase, short-chain alcohol dehydrogenase family [Halovenus aranensis]|jgi:NAD(P)-dependent dehydrogenase (short-subunit alcohol dehydrogenase family)|uniref:NAD(P)-dependent dehydrogenase, short-chain alcohol dehydrogenase family n=1 Tax=Halovenus aranensis TaxID=890420 RepID=A0A1G8SKJ8_9EURY|nr:oxidoreductase [Halovenus aranensis]SDJ29693.1 NAD(P)-dependent dehydrogenase, short-chain alcohol dehydrogenase family [Halovenus aranensis]